MSDPEMTPAEMALWVEDWRWWWRGGETPERAAEMATLAVLALRETDQSALSPAAEDLLRQVRGKERLRDETSGAMPFDRGAGT